MDIEVNTTEYQFSHGHKPRGTGAWAFTFKPGPNDGYFWHTGSYTEAKKAAIKEGRKRGAYKVIVGS